MTRQQRIAQCCNRARAFNAANRIAAMNRALAQARRADNQKFIQDDVDTLADEFVKVIQEWLSADELAEVVSRNNELYDDNPNICATHDFCDANMAMDEAFKNCKFATPFDLSTEDGSESDQHYAALKLWGSAWDKAKARNFDVAYAE